jgi:hypothetical protein
LVAATPSHYIANKFMMVSMCVNRFLFGYLLPLAYDDRKIPL